MKTVYRSKASGKFVSPSYARRYPNRVIAQKVEARNQFN